MGPDKTISLRLVAVVAGILTLAGCASFQEKIPFVGSQYRIRNEGYSLLYELAGDEQNVDKILILKSANAKVTAVIKDIAQNFSQAHERLDAFAQQDARLRFDTPRLPTLEKQTRAAIASKTTRTLLFSSGREFEVALLLTQVQALQYATYLAEELSDQDDNKIRKTFLNQFSKQCEQQHQRVIQLLSQPAD